MSSAACTGGQSYGHSFNMSVRNVFKSSCKAYKPGFASQSPCQKSLAMIVFPPLVSLLLLTHTTIRAAGSPLRTVQTIDLSERQSLGLPLQHSNTSILSLEFALPSNSSDDIQDVKYPIPGTNPWRYLQMSYNRADPVDAAPYRTVVTTILTMTRNRIARYGDGPLESDPWTLGIPGCFSSTRSISEADSHSKPVTLSMLKEIMFVFKIMLEGKERFFEVFYDLVDEDANPLAEGSLLLEEESLSSAG